MGCTTGRKLGQIMLICLMAMMSTGSSSALGDSRSIVDDRLKPLSNEEGNKLPIKKAYTYVSEYKRLPVFNFGIGKRFSDVNGIKGAQPYSFGFGKRSLASSFYPTRNRLDYMRYDDNDDISAHLLGGMKRALRIRPYNFGLGKRSVLSEYEKKNMAMDREDVEDLRKPLNDDLEQRFLYDLNNGFVVDDQGDLQQDD